MARIGENLFNLLEYFGVRSESYYHSCPAVSYDPDDPLAYYLDQSQRAQYQGPFDDSGVPLYPYGDQLVYLPVHIIPYALGQLEIHRQSGEERGLENFKNCVDWLDESQLADGAWLMPIPSRRFGLNGPWRSAMVQGLGISCLVRAAQVFDEGCYLDSATKALGLYRLEVEHGGVASHQPDGVFYEEYPCEPACHVLNGFLFALWGLFDLMRLDSTSEATSLWEDGLVTLEKWLPRYDIGYWSLYHIPAPPRNPATIPYHRLHINQLKVMFELTQRQIFREYATKWQAYLDSHFNALRTLPAKLNWLVKKV